jgi:hypothetical protein
MLIISVTVVLWLSVECAVLAKSEDDQVVHANGFGSFLLGMTYAEVSRVAELDITSTEGYVEGDCASFNIGPWDAPDVRFIFQHGQLVLIDVYLAGAKTPEKVGVGSCYEEIFQVYGGMVKSVPGHYGGQQVFVKIAESENSYRFTFDDKKTPAVLVRIATDKDVGLIEGCL